MSSTILHARKKGKGISFHHNFGKAPVSLRSVAIEDDGLPKLVFDTATCRNLPTLTEEDVATVARLVTEGKRPGFFYRGCDNPHHPFFDYGRLYKYYSPQWLGGTSVGDLLSEADWSMKCLHVGTRSNPSKTEFRSWQETSKLENLAVHMDFPHGDTIGCVLMSCDNVKYEESENEIFFLGEPKMRITDRSKPMYTEYITEYFNNVAYHDEPLFLKMQELVKLVIAFEWMKKKGIHFNEKWMKYHTEKKQQALAKPTGIRPMMDTEKVTQQVIDGYKAKGTVQVQSVKQMPTRAEIVMTKNLPGDSEQQIITIRLSIDDYDFLYDGMDCQMPMTINDEGDLIFPDVKSWSELFNETVPIPCAFGVFCNNMEMVTGGVTTANISTHVRKVEKVRKPEHATTQVKASRKIISQSQVKPDIPPVEIIAPPSTNVHPRTLEHELNTSTRKMATRGQIDRTGATFQSGSSRGDISTYKVSVKEETRHKGKKVSEKRYFPKGTGHFEITSNSGKNSLKEKQRTHEIPAITQNSRPSLSPVPSDSGLESSSTLTSEGEGVQQRCPDIDNMLEITPNSRLLSPAPSDSGLGSSSSSTLTSEGEGVQQRCPDVDQILGITPNSRLLSPAPSDSGLGSSSSSTLTSEGEGVQQRCADVDQILGITPNSRLLSPAPSDSGLGSSSSSTLTSEGEGVQQRCADVDQILGITPNSRLLSPDPSDSGLGSSSSSTLTSEGEGVQQRCADVDQILGITPNSRLLSPAPSDSGLGSSSSSTLTSEGEGVQQRCADVDQILGITPNSRLLSPAPSDSGLGSSSSSTLTSEGEGVQQRCADVDQILGITPSSRPLSPVSSDSGLGSSNSSVTTITDEEIHQRYADIDEVLGIKDDSSDAESDGSDTDMET